MPGSSYGCKWFAGSQEHLFSITSSDYDIVTKLTYPSISIIKGLVRNKTVSVIIFPPQTPLRQA
jgi:hypothetical protein